MLTRYTSKQVDISYTSVENGVKEWSERDNLIRYNREKRCFVSKKNNDNTNDDEYEGYLSVTKWIHGHFEPFDADKVIEKMMKSPKWPESKYYELTADEIKILWKKKGDEAARAGTKMHALIEDYYNGKYTLKQLYETNNNNMKEIEQFYNFELGRIAGYGKTWEPYRTEWRVFDEELLILGIIDMVYIDTMDGQLILCDWKRSNEIKKTNRWQQSKTECISHIPDSNYWHYTLQLNMYKHILERKYNKKVKQMFLAVFHPENTNFIKLDVPSLNDEMEQLIQLRMQHLVEVEKIQK